MQRWGKENVTTKRRLHATRRPALIGEGQQNRRIVGMLATQGGLGDFLRAIQHPNRVAPYLNNYGTALFELGRKREAEVQFRRALELREAKFGPMHGENSETLLNLAVICAEGDRWTEGRAYVERSLAIRQQLYGTSHPSLVPALNA